jgi:aspartyl-tRNA(Asn)/glutamyl-tRNA(Gln) amidotransferase subunit A
LALGSDGGGSIRVPAALTGIVGFKPSFGRVPVWPGCRDHRLPGVSSWESLEHIGPMARTVSDIVLAFSVLGGPDQRDRHSLPSESIEPPEVRGLRIAYSSDLGFAAVDSEVAEVTEVSVKTFARTLGATVEVATPQVGDVQSTFEALVALDTDRIGLRTMRETTGIPFGPELTRLLEQDWSADDFSAAVMERKRVSNLMSVFMADWDLFATPATACAAFAIELDHPSRIAGQSVGRNGMAPFSALANLTGQPAITLPAGLTADGRPVGLQLIGRHLADHLVVAAAAAFEAANPFPNTLEKTAKLRRFSC